MNARPHLLSLSITALALALGLGVGAGPVAEQAARDDERARERLQSRLLQQQDELDAARRASVTDASAIRDLAATVVGERLNGRSVVVVATPGAVRGDVRRARVALEELGAVVTGILTLTDTYVDPARAQSPLEDLALRLVPPGVDFRSGLTPIERVGVVLARSVVQRPEGGEEPSNELDRDAAEVLAGLDELDALRLHGDPGLRAELAVVVTGTADGAESRRPALVGLAQALGAASSGVVVTGPGDAGDGLLRWLREGRESGESAGISTVDGLGTAAGRAALVMALAEQASGEGGHYGAGALADRVLPALSAPAGADRVEQTPPTGG